ncbi:Thiolase, N-terminal domain-containing protein [Kockiozyma suomiensis]|uniref:Thiolase, N-terminal domain-containing protein n=1 Tax=Kockiozyma suomiensis TaxID=1337062 RepID=UPI003343148C
MATRGIANILAKKATDVVIVSALRTPFTKSLRGGLANMYPEELLASVLKATIDRSGINPAEVNDVLTGAVLQTLGGQKASATAIKKVGFPFTTTSGTVNRQCSSSAQAASFMAGAIQSGSVDVGIAAGVESMTMDYFPHRGIPTRVSEAMISEPGEAQDVLMPMGITSENVASEFGISREDQDVFAALSHEKAAQAWADGFYSDEVIPVTARKVYNEKKGEKPPEDGSVEWVTISKDDGVRAGTTAESLAKLKPVFSESGATTAGNSSQISDGASAVLLMSRTKADALGLKPIGKFVASVTAGVPARLMGIAPAVAVPKLLNLAGLNVSDIDVFELNEAFASQSLYCIREIGVDVAKLNPGGGAIAIGHPLGATGGRCIATLLNGLGRSGGKLGVVSMCASTGQGYAGLFAAE